MEDQFRTGFQRHRGRCLRYPVSHGGDPEHPGAPRRLGGYLTARTGGGKYVPEDSRFQTLYRLFFRSAPNASTVTPSLATRQADWKVLHLSWARQPART
jgi:hypothetical protein